MRIYLFLFFTAIFFTPSVLFAQEYERKKESADMETKIQVEDIKKNSLKKGFTKFLGKLLIRNPKSKSQSREWVNRPGFEHTHGKIIRNIEITTLDPFGYSVNDTTRKPERWVEKAGNTLHIKSKKIAIRNYLLFSKNKVLDSVIILETERLLRRQQFVRRVVIEANPVGKDSVDVKIRVLDAWSSFITPSMSSSGFKGKFKERNFMGVGHTFSNRIDHRTSDGKTGYSGNYLIPNIYHTYINSNIRFTNDLENNQYKTMAFNRPFYSSNVKWAGGVELSELRFNDSIPDAQEVFERQHVNYFQQRYWAGYSFKLNDIVRSSRLIDNRLITSIGYTGKNFADVPEVAFDSIGFYSNERHLLLNIALSSNSYVQDSYLFRNDEIEDVPIGRLYSVTTGLRRKREQYQFYLGLKYSFGNYHKFGYLGADFQAGSYFDKGEFYQAALNIRLNYFTRIIELGSWRLRQFMAYNIVYGLERDPVYMDKINLLGDAGIIGFNNTVRGNKKTLLTLQTQTYTPGDVLGFRFNPFLNLNLALISDKGKSLTKSPLYSKISLGALITNDYFVIDHIRISLSYYPYVPKDGSHIFEMSGSSSNNIRIPNFISGQPDVVPYTHPRELDYK